MKNKKMLAVLFASAMMLGNIPVADMTTNMADLTVCAYDEDEEETKLQYENFFYEIMNDGNVMITGYDKPETPTETDEDGNVIENSQKIDIVIPSRIDGRNVTEIGNSAFGSYGSSSIGEVTLPNTIKKINAFAFDSIGATKVNIPDSVEHIGYGAFQNCKSLKEVTLGKNIDSLLCWVFTGCEKLEKINGLDHIKNFQSFCLNGTKLIENMKAKNPMVIINNVLIDAGACEGDIVIPDGVTRIIGEAFYVEGHYENAAEGDGAYIPEWVEGECKVTSVHIPASCTMLEPASFRRGNMPNLKTVTIDSANPRYSSVNGMILSHNGTVLELVPAKMKTANIPDTVTEIGGAMSNSEALTSVKLPKGLKTISKGMLFNCPNLTEITIPDGVTRIEKHAFSGTGIKKISIPDSVTYVHALAFNNTPLLDNQTRDVKYADKWVIGFAGKTSNEDDESEERVDAVIKSGTVGIADVESDYSDYDNYNYYGDSNLEPDSLVIPDSVKYICRIFTKLDDLKISDSLIKTYAYNFVQTPWSKANQKTVTLDNGLKVRENIIVDGYDCTGELVVPEGIIGIVPKAFYLDNENSDERESEWAETDWENRKWGSDITSIILPDSIKRLDGKPFVACKSLKTIQLPEHLEYLGELMANHYDDGYFTLNDAYEAPEHLILPETLTDGKCMMEGQWLNCVTVPGSLKEFPDGYATGGGYLYTNFGADYIIFSEGMEALGDTSVKCGKAVFIPKSMENIGQGAFCMSDGMTDVFYAGSEEDWNNISIASSGYWYIHNANLFDANIHFNSTVDDLLKFANINEKGTGISGDVNADGKFNIADAVALQNWLLNDGTSLADWKAADLCEDGKLDVFDLCLMRRLLLQTDN